MKPDYKGGSIVNLMSSIINARGGKALYPECKKLRSSSLKKAKNVVLVVLDGMGVSTLKKHSPKGFFMKHMKAPITSVFPSTTSAAMTTYYTGVAPQQHGITGWYMYLREIGAVSTILPFIHIDGGSLAEKGYGAEDFVWAEPVYDQIKTTSYKVIPEHIDGEWTKGTMGKSKKIVYKSFNSMFKRLETVLKKPGKKYVHVYWDKIDSLSHMGGPQDEDVGKHLLELEKKFEKLVSKLKGSNTHIIICADHGLVQTTNVEYLQSHPKLMECLLLPACAESRAMYLYVRPGKAKQF